MAHVTDRLKVIGDPEAPSRDKEQAIIDAGRAGCLSNLLPLIGDPSVDISLQTLAISRFRGRDRDHDLIYLLEKREMPPLVRKAVEEMLFEDTKLASGKGYLRTIIMAMEGRAVPQDVRTLAGSLLERTIDNAISRDFYLGFPELLGKAWVPEDLQLRALRHWEKGRATDTDLGALLRRNGLPERVTMEIVDALFRRGATSRVPERLKLKRLRRGRDMGGLLIHLRDFQRPRRGKARPPAPPIIQGRVRRKVC